MLTTIVSSSMLRLRSSRILIVVLLFGCALDATTLHAQTPIGTAFTYQGRLTDNGVAATGLYDLRFVLYDVSVGGSQVGPIVVRDDISSSGGVFTILLDFGNVFTGSSRFLEIAVRPGASTGTFTVVSPRQELTPTPNAVFASSAATLTGVSCSAGELLKWNGTKWTCGGLTGSEISAGTIPFSAWSTNSCTSGQIPKFNGSSWQCDTDIAIAGGGNTAFNGPNSSALLAGPGVGLTGPLGVYGTGNTGVYGAAVARGVWGWAPTGTGVLGQGTTGLWGEGLDSSSAGVFGVLSFPSGTGVGVVGQVSSGEGVAIKGLNVATSGEGIGLYGSTQSPTGVGVYGRSETFTGFSAGFVGSTGVWGDTFYGTGVYGTSTRGTGVIAWSETGYGLRATGAEAGVIADGAKVGLLASGIDTGMVVAGGIGIRVDNGGIKVGSGGITVQAGGIKVLSGDTDIQDLKAANIQAGTFIAPVKLFRIDHPLDPENRYLQHASIESSEIKNLYDGTVLLDDRGEAEVTMPSWFEALNGDFRYQLTPISAPMPNLYVAKEIANGTFRIAGGVPGKKLSWQVTGVRHDAAVLANPLEVEKPKAHTQLPNSKK